MPAEAHSSAQLVQLQGLILPLGRIGLEGPKGTHPALPH